MEIKVQTSRKQLFNTLTCHISGSAYIWRIGLFISQSVIILKTSRTMSKYFSDQTFERKRSWKDAQRNETIFTSFHGSIGLQGGFEVQRGRIRKLCSSMTKLKHHKLYHPNLAVKRDYQIPCAHLINRVSHSGKHLRHLNQIKSNQTNTYIFIWTHDWM